MEMIANRELFLELFPKYFEKSMSKAEQSKFEGII